MRGHGPAWGTTLAILTGCLGPVASTAALPVAPAPTMAEASCPAGSTVDIIAHPDDDLLFQGATLVSDVAGGRCVRTVYVTAGGDDRPDWYWRAREAGVEAAYARLSGHANEWTTATAAVTGHAITQRTLAADPRISLLFLRLPDGGLDGQGLASTRGQSLKKLRDGSIGTIDTVVGGQSFTAAGLVDVLVALLRDFAPDAVHTLDFDGVDGDGDHSDHYAVAAFAAEAQARYSTPHSFVGFEGYGIAGLPENVVGPVLDQKRAAFLAYGQYDFLSCGVLSACGRRPEGAWLSREYTVAGSTPRPLPAPQPGAAPRSDSAGGS